MQYWRIYLMIALPTLVALALLTGPFQVPDEPSHFYRAVQLSHGKAQPVVAATGKDAGDYIEASAGVLGFKYGRLDVDFDTTHRFALADVMAAMERERDLSLVFTAFSNTVIYFPVVHLLPAVAIGIARHLGAPPLAWLYVGRLTNALAALLVSAIAIALFREAGVFALAFCTLPMTLFLEASLSTDALILPFSILMCALVFKVAKGDTFGWRLYGLLLASLLYVCVAKFAYMPLVLLPPLVAMVRRRSRSMVSLIAGVSLVATAMWAGWSFFVRSDVFSIRPDVPNIDVHGQLQFVLHAPLAYLQTFFGAVRENLFAMLKEMIGSRLGWLSLPTPKLLTLLAFVSLGVAATCRRSATFFGSGVFLITTALLTASFAAIFLLLYFQFNPIGSPKIDGTQGRYLLPLLAFVPVFAPRWRTASPWAFSTDLLCVVLSGGVSVAIIVFVWLSYWTI